MEKQIEEMANDIGEKQEAGWKFLDDGYMTDVFNQEVAEHLVAKGWRKQNWISVEERLPECENGAETEALLFITSAGSVEAGYFGRGSVWRDVYFRHYRNHVGWDVSDVTHWMPLPPAPKGE